MLKRLKRKNNMTFDQMAFGYEGAEKKEMLALEIEKIEEKNSSFFADRKSKINPEKLDKLKNHIHFDIADTGFTTIIFTDDELPQYIIDEVRLVHQSIFPKQDL